MADTPQAEFLYKVKPKLQNQFKAAEAGGVPFALILGEVSSFSPWLFGNRQSTHALH